ETLRVRLRDAAADAESSLASVSGVHEVRREGGLYLLKITPSEEVRAAVAEEVARGGWGLVEMTPMQTTLEDVFIRYMASDAPGAAV
ncbi:MAG: DUF4162 domain-containing protein, partial [Candidatus Methylomirabilis sp.]|nr:DUF4162 domain-containing protein [Deltaproteobacteria bacterium]